MKQKLTIDLFNMLMIDGVTLTAIFEQFDEDSIKRILTRWVEQMNDAEDYLKDEFLFYDAEDCNALEKLGFQILIAK